MQFSLPYRRPDLGDRSKFDVPELMHNLNTLLDVTEEQIYKTHREIKFLNV